IRTPLHISELKNVLPEVYNQLLDIAQKLERHYKDMQDFEFTVERGKLYMLQTRTGKRTGMAALKIAVDMVDEGLINEKEAVLRVEPSALEQVLHPMFDPKERAKHEPVAKGLNASPGAATGRAVFTPEDAVEWAKRGEKVILVRPETSPDDIAGMSVAQGILTSTGGMTSHAAVVGRQMGKPSVVGCSDIKVDEDAKKFEVKGKTVKEGDWISIDGTTGEVFLAALPTVPSEIIQVVQGKMKKEEAKLYNYFERLLSWADKYRKLGVRANADTPRDAKLARLFGAEGIGLARTEHMFFAEERLPIMQKMILSETEEERKEALSKLLPMQREDFYGLLKEMRGYEVTIRLLDPPLHEFLPKREELLQEIAKKKRILESMEYEAEHSEEARKIVDELEDELEKLNKLLKRVEELHEFNPMLGHRGCRLGITYNEITEMQARAIFEAAARLVKEGEKIQPEVMVPLVGHVKEIEDQKRVIDKIAKEVMAEYGVKIKYKVGTMIEVPRAALTADQIASVAEFFSFGTNDLTQMTFALSRDDAGKFLNIYIDKGIWPKDPFQTLDKEGVGELMKIGVRKGRKARRNLKVGICGEHGGDPDSIDFCHEIGLNYVSASPYRVPVARLAAARAALIRE
ncbi:MAG: pyruvate, phosphate dikinase, partial [Candidatus Aminicenantes bacterium]|nr:pyruvate, phosphate dikinase [Candidatus Aminicenantes bacterium]